MFFYTSSLFQINHMVHWNAPCEDIFSVRRRDFFVLHDVHSQHVYLQEESLPGVLRLKKHSKFVQIIFYLELINSGHADTSMADKNHDKLSSWR